MPHGTYTTHDTDSSVTSEKRHENSTKENEENVPEPSHYRGSSADMTSNASVSRAVEESEMRKDV